MSYIQVTFAQTTNKKDFIYEKTSASWVVSSAYIGLIV